MKPQQKANVIVHGTLSEVATGCAEHARAYHLERDTQQGTTFHRLIDGDYLALRLQVPTDRRPLLVGLARVLWIQGDRLEVEVLIMDADERIRLNRFLEATDSDEIGTRNACPTLILSTGE
ncbi:MAG: hypothetical protein JSR62_03705 [Nitrospira sp.]|nr:hypothetical protein [Nitrospira sp.]